MDRRDYLQAFRASIDVPAGARARNLAAIYDRLAQPPADADEESVNVEPTPVRGRWAAGLFVVKSVGISLAIGAGGLGLMSFGLQALNQHRTAPEPAAVRALESADGRSQAPPAASVAADSTVPAPSPAVKRQPPAPAPTASAPHRRAPATAAPSPADDRLGAEVELMRRAEAALKRSDYVVADRLLLEHLERFRDGALAPERDAWRVVVQCELARDDARAQYQEFVRVHGGSGLLPQVRRACEGRFSATDVERSRDESP